LFVLLTVDFFNAAVMEKAALVGFHKS